ncbi:MAG: MCP four helix bundle domain-containing protein [Chitinophagaceae bacterium]|nr:MCP four helix bundle domain-containing protein [Rubrivivax sp.]
MTRPSPIARGQAALLRSVGQWPLGRKLYSAFGIMLILMACLGALAVVGLARVDAQAGLLASKWLQGVGHLAAMRSGLMDMRDHEIKHSRTDDRSYHTEYEEKIAEGHKVFSQGLAAYQALLGGAAEREMLAKFDKHNAAYLQAQKKVIALGRDKKQQDAADVSEGMSSAAFDDAVGALNALSKFNFDGGQAEAQAARSTFDQVKLAVFGLLGAGLSLGIGLAWVITRQLLRQLGGEPGAAADVARAVAEGDLTSAIDVRAGDTNSVMARLQAMQRGLVDAVSQVRQGSEQVATASSEIAQGNQDLSGRTEQQASALQQTAATMDELGSTVRNNADNARQANQLALTASGVAVKGGEMVSQVVQTMKGINDSSKKIADIISVIDGIAFQTNILALNAAVEAARAGEQGRGFAVVAAEVRSLAQRSAEAAKQIKVLISASVERVAHGTALVDQAGHTMEEIVASIKRVSDIVGEISSASVEQSSGVAQVGQAVTQMDQATQQNAALVEQSAAAAASLRQQAQSLVQAVAVFKLAH